MEHVIAEINETVQLAALDGIENVYLAKVVCSHPIRLQSDVGKRLHAHATGLGNVLLAFLPDAELNSRFDGKSLPAFNVNTIRDPHLAAGSRCHSRARFRGRRSGIPPGLRCVAVPIFDIDGNVLAAVSASIPLMRAEEAPLELALRAIAAASIDISLRLGRARPDQRLVALTIWQGDVFAG